MAVHMVSSAKGVLFRVFQLRVASFRVAGVALRDSPTCFMTCQKWFCVANVILRGGSSTLDVSGCVLSTNRSVSAARSGDMVQIPWHG